MINYSSPPLLLKNSKFDEEETIDTMCVLCHELLSIELIEEHSRICFNMAISESSSKKVSSNKMNQTILSQRKEVTLDE
jgi:hypothetical protein